MRAARRFGLWTCLFVVLALVSAVYGAHRAEQRGRADGYRAGYSAGLAVKKPAPPVVPLDLFQFTTCGRTVGWLLVRTDGSAAYGAWADVEEPEQLEAVGALADKTGGLTILQFDCLM